MLPIKDAESPVHIMLRMKLLTGTTLLYKRASFVKE